MIAIFFATKLESRVIIEELKSKSEFIIRNVGFVKGRINNIETLLCISGIGKVNSSISALITFEKFPIKRIIISGIAGAYPSSGLKVGEIAIAQKEIDADTGLLINCEEEKSFIEIVKEEINLSIPEICKNLPMGTFLTVSSSTGNTKRARFLERRFSAICENMEGFAIAKVATLYSIPAAEIRVISNIVTDRDRLLELTEVSNTAEIVQRFIIENFPLFELPL